MSGAKIIAGLKDAVANNFSRVTIDGQKWARVDWQPIETAPAGDDDLFLVCGVGDDRSPFVVRGDVFKNGRRSDTPRILHLRWITHWMPLPERPQ